ncbi:ABC transporter ATPase [Clostridium sp. VAP52]|uniref:ABC transporter ATPase n=1 Tax=Clostridium sp. VAP52 TaxID=2949977 RepID=UPI0020794C02|nr:ABC transporter ATPase [Clostridium sp. VAP52]
MEFKNLRNGLITQKYTQVKEEVYFQFNAPHTFLVESLGEKEPKELCKIHFREGAIKEHGVNGVCDEDLIAMVIRRLEGFQDSAFKCKENEKALERLQESLMWLRKRTIDREIRGVEGTHVI